ncbi:uncharacterized protein LOC117122087 isoform X2 [Anneissia japonica]|uniref:uncharacterized protein LOC117122087 isoform X2 n=1 Tax=Anneissia japonica TaxID=1529436 RepID=UPI00142587B3|nr:uncharacterized protein LOC117122087 isoform X2 [Anneissia japonica]
MRQMKISLGWICLTSFTFFMVEAVPLTERKMRQVSVCKSGCEAGYQVNHACCKAPTDCAESDFCERCVDGTYLLGEGIEAYCNSCTVCQSNEVQLQNCTKTTNAKCECKPDYYRSSSQICLKCPECIKADCPDGCSPKEPPLQGIPTSTIEPNVSNIRHDLPHPTDLTTPTNVREMTSSTMSSIIALDGEPDIESWWKPKVYIPLILSPVFILAIVGFATKVLCCWTEKSKTFWTNYCPCFLRCGCCNPNDASSLPRRNEDNENNYVISNILFCSCFSPPDNNQDNRRNHGNRDERPQSDTNGNNAVSGQNEERIALRDINSSNEQNTNQQNADVADGIPNAEAQPLLNQGRNDSASGSNVQNGASVVKLGPPPKSRRRLSSSNLPPVPEDTEVQSTASETFVLPDWCFSDASRVTKDHISVLSRKIGSKGILVAGLLDLHKGEVENIEHNHKSDLVRQNYEILYLWLDKKGVVATKKILAKALVNVGIPQEATHLWPDRELYPVTPTTPQNESVFWKRRSSNDTNIKVDTSAFDKMDWTDRNTWYTITKQIRDNDYGGFQQLCFACGGVELKLPKYKRLKKFPNLSDNLHLKIDKYANTLMNSDLQTLTAIVVANNGNCLFSTASIIAFGSSNHCCQLRLRTFIELCYHKDYYLHQKSLMQCIKAEYSLTKMEDDNKLSYSAIEGIYEGCVRDTLNENLPFSLHGNSIQLFGLASVLGCNIQTVYPTNDQNPLNALIPPRDLSIENPITVYVMWSRHTPLSEDELFHPNHFVPLLKK